MCPFAAREARGAALPPPDSDRAVRLMSSRSVYLMRTQSAGTLQRIIRHIITFVPLLKLNAHPGGSTAGWAFVIPYGKFSYLCTVGSVQEDSLSFLVRVHHPLSERSARTFRSHIFPERM